MKNYTTIDKTFQALIDKLDNVTRSSENKITASCPAHDDEHNSLSVSKEKDRILIKCFAGCSFKDVVSALGFKESDMFTYGGGHVTLEDYAEFKRLPIDFLRSRFKLGTIVRNRQKVVHVPYFNAAGETVAVRFREALEGGARFSWRTGDKPCPYGLHLLNEARKIGYIVLVEGESDTHTFWYYNIPALGIPGATSWRQEWKAYVDGLKVYVWKEADGGGESLVRSVAKDLPDALVITAPSKERKDISAYHVAGEDVVAVFEAMRSQAKPISDLLAQETAELIEEALKKAGDLVDCKDILSRFTSFLPSVGLVGEDNNAKIIYLALTSRLLKKPVSVVVKGPSSGGKSYLAGTVLKFFPEESYLDFTNMSGQALVYDKRPLQHKFVVLYEAETLKQKEDKQQNNPAYYVRSLISENRLKYTYTLKHEKGDFETKELVREGPTGLLTTTTQVLLDQELETRLLSLTVRDDKEQTKSIFEAIATRFEEKEKDEVNLEQWKAFQSWLELAGVQKVLIPYAKTLSRLVLPEATRLRRDFEHVLTLVGAHALLHQRHRVIDVDGYVIASLDDYRVVYDLIHAIVSEGVEASVKDTVRQTVQAVRRFCEEKKKPATVSDIQRILNIDKAAVSRRLREALDKGFIAVDDSSRGTRRKYTPGTPLPEDMDILPTPETLESAVNNGINPDEPPPAPGGAPNTPIGAGRNGYIPEMREEVASEVELYEDVANEDEAVRTIKYPASQTSPLLPVPNIVWLNTPQDVEKALQDIAQQEAVGLDVETTVKVVGKRGKKDIVKPDKLRLVQLATPDKVYMLDAFKTDVTLLTPLFSNENLVVVGHNLKFDLTMLRKAGLDAPGDVKLMDTMIASQLLSAGLEEAKPRKKKKGEKGYHSLEKVVERYLKISIDKSFQDCDWSGVLTQEQIEYAARDAQVLLPLRLAMRIKLKAYNLIQAMAIEMEALPTVVLMEETGVLFDQTKWQPEIDKALQRFTELERQLNDEAGVRINWKSPPQVFNILRQRGHTIPNTRKETLIPIASNDPLVSLLLEYRKQEKLLQTFGQESEFLDSVGPDGRIHPEFNQCGAVTGRMSCEAPNLQQIPRNSGLRECFVAPAGRALVKADYSQIELRIAAELTNDERMLEIYNSPAGDIHTLTAQLVMGKDDVEKPDRQKAKAINFGLIYGMQPQGLRNYAAISYGTEMSEEEAERFYRRFFETYTGIARWHRMTRYELRENTKIETRTASGRRRLDVDSLNEALNTPVQGTGADGLKAALGLLWKTRRRFPTARPILAVHDEIVVECDAHEAEAVEDWLVDCMKQGMKQFLPSVPVEVEATIAEDWAGKKLLVTG